MLQTHTGCVPDTLVAEEVQSWLMGRAHPAICKANELMLARDPVLAKKHAALQKKLNWDEDKMGFKLYFLSWDGAGAHSLNNFRLARATKTKPEANSRLTAKKGTSGWICLEPCQFIARADKVPDANQEPVEMILGIGKRATTKLLHELPGLQKLTWQQMVDAVRQAFKREDWPKLTRGCWQKAVEAMKVFSGPVGTTRDVVVRGKRVRADCTGGGPVPKRMRG